MSEFSPINDHGSKLPIRHHLVLLVLHLQPIRHEPHLLFLFKLSLMSIFTSLRILCNSRLLAEQAALRTGVELGWVRWVELGWARWGVAGAEGNRPQFEPGIEKSLPCLYLYQSIIVSFNYRKLPGGIADAR